MKGKRVVEQEYCKINETWRVGRDKWNFILQRKGQKAEGVEGTKDNWVTIGFYQNFKQIYHTLVERNIKEISLVDMKAVNEKIEELHKLIEDAHAKGVMNREI